MLDEQLFESHRRRVGVEQEYFLIDDRGRPAPVGAQILPDLAIDGFTSEIALFNIEANLAPLDVHDQFVERLESGLSGALARAEEAASGRQAHAVLTGILPSLRMEDLDLANMTPSPRYEELNRKLMRLRGEEFRTSIRGWDEIEVRHESVMLEAANTSLQLHLQVDPNSFAAHYNVAQWISAPLLAAATNSPLLLGRRLWSETRIALFESSVDARTPAELQRNVPSRVFFGRRWVEDSVLEVYRDNLMIFPVVLDREPGLDALECLRSGEIPTLDSLNYFNGTVWRWNRPCLGVIDGIPHLRIENRVLPAGPTVEDEVANAALFYGLMFRLTELYGEELRHRIPFDQVRANFRRAAKLGLDCRFQWLDGRDVDPSALLLDELIPEAHRGLIAAGTSPEVTDHYLGIVSERVRRGATGAAWLLDARSSQLEEEASQTALEDLTGELLERQTQGDPVHRWKPFRTTDRRCSVRRGRMLREVMSTELFTVRPHDSVSLALHLWRWSGGLPVPVEDENGLLVGIVTTAPLIELERHQSDTAAPRAVREIMQADPPLAPLEASIEEASVWLREHGLGCVLVGTEGRLHGFVTEGSAVGTEDADD